ncbi:MAG: hypothetical protein BWY83_01930 [bacterium ADurb.Bin478]|nr:MAG: hypothetical protein BWY83_01930 [bacterium ADurb.Bin478]
MQLQRLLRAFIIQFEIRGHDGIDGDAGRLQRRAPHLVDSGLGDQKLQGLTGGRFPGLDQRPPGFLHRLRMKGDLQPGEGQRANTPAGRLITHGVQRHAQQITLLAPADLMAAKNSRVIFH